MAKSEKLEILRESELYFRKIKAFICVLNKMDYQSRDGPSFL